MPIPLTVWESVFYDLWREERQWLRALSAAHTHIKRADDDALPGPIASPQPHESRPHGVYKRIKTARLEQSVCTAARRPWTISVTRIVLVP